MKIITGRSFEICGYLGLVFMWIWLALSYQGLPDQVPIHFNFQGRPDNYGHKLMMLILPLIATILFPILTKAAKNQVAGKLQAVGVVIALAVLLLKSIQVAQGNSETIGVFFLPVAIGLVFLPGIAYAITAKTK